MKKHTIGYFGGSFDPIHSGHLAIAMQFKTYCHLDDVFFLPVGHPSHKPSLHAHPYDRLSMLYMSIKGLPNIHVDEREIHRSGASYTIDTLKELHHEYNQQNIELWFLIGEDSYNNLHTWKNWRELFEYTRFAVAPRPGEHHQTNHAIAPYEDHIVHLPPLCLDISATKIRENPIDCPKEWLHAEVRMYIQQKKLYGIINK